MRVTFLAHDGFFIELDQVCLLFDWWKGVLPPLPDKPLLVFVSHRHEDHFNPAVFTLADCQGGHSISVRQRLSPDAPQFDKVAAFPGDRRQMPPLRQA